MGAVLGIGEGITSLSPAEPPTFTFTLAWVESTTMYGMPLPPVPKSGCSPTVVPMNPMIVFELPSTWAVEMSWFQALVLGNGRKPLRLAPCPTAMLLQAVVLPVTAVTAADADFDVSAALVADTV